MRTKTNFDWYLPVLPKGATKAARNVVLDAHWYFMDHWWKELEGAEVSREAAIYELLRRHPRIGAERAKLEYPASTIRSFDAIKRYNEYAAIRLIEVLLPICPKPWPKLDSEDRKTFTETLLGTDLGKSLPRPLNNPIIAKSQKPGEQALADAHHFAYAFMKEIRAMNGFPREYVPSPSLGRKNPFSLLYSALIQGRLILSVDVLEQHDPQARIESVSELYRAEIKRHSFKGLTRRANIQSILKTIAEFEDSEILRLRENEPKKVNHGKRDRFQKLFNGITPFESK